MNYVIAVFGLHDDPVFCTMCKKQYEYGPNNPTCYSCGCHVCPSTTDCSFMVEYLGKRRRLCVHCIEMREDESPELAQAAAQIESAGL